MGEITGASEQASQPLRNDENLDPADVTAIGGHLMDLPPGYYRSSKFVGSIIGVVLMANSLYLGFVLPVRHLSPFAHLTQFPNSTYTDFERAVKHAVHHQRGSRYAILTFPR